MKGLGNNCFPTVFAGEVLEGAEATSKDSVRIAKRLPGPQTKKRLFAVFFVWPEGFGHLFFVVRHSLH
jgi:hypothetical protein